MAPGAFIVLGCLVRASPACRWHFFTCLCEFPPQVGHATRGFGLCLNALLGVLVSGIRLLPLFLNRSAPGPRLSIEKYVPKRGYFSLYPFVTPANRTNQGPLSSRLEPFFFEQPSLSSFCTCSFWGPCQKTNVGAARRSMPHILS